MQIFYHVLICFCFFISVFWRTIFFGIAKEVQYTDFDFYSLYVLSYIQEIFAKCKLMTFYPILFSGSFFFLILFLLYFTVQYCIGFAIHWHEFTTGVHAFPNMNPRSHLPPHNISLGHHRAPMYARQQKRQMCITDFWTQRERERERVGWFEKSLFKNS